VLKREVLGDSSVDLAKLYVDKSVVLRRQGKYNEAFANLEEALNINNLHFNANHVYFARICLENGRTYYRKKSYLAAKEQLEEALEIYQAQPKQDLREHANASEALGLVYLETGFLSEASKRFKKAMEIKMSIYESQHPEIAETLYNEARVLLKMAGSDDKGGEKLQNSARQKLKKALRILQENKENGAELTEVIESTLSTL
jgi:tetratricopeptide (TPR) repeat protein